MKEIEIKNLKVASRVGKYFRVSATHVPKEAIGLEIALVIKGNIGPMPVGTLTSVTPEAVWIKSPTTGQVLVVNPSIIFGWIPFKTLIEDFENKEFQAHPEEFCKPGFNPEGVAVI